MVSSFPAKDWTSDVTNRLHGYSGLQHLRVAARGDTLTIQSSDAENPFTHARLRRISVSLWTIEMSVRGNRWEPTGVRATIADAIVVLTEQFGWTLESVD